MKRLLPIVALSLAIVQPALAFDPTPREAGNRITLLQGPTYHGGEYEERAAARIRKQLVSELRERGYDAIDGEMSYDDAVRGGRRDSGLYIEIAPDSATTDSAAIARVDLPHASVDLAVLVSRVAAELRVYDARSLNLIVKRNLHRQDVRVVPTGVGTGTYRASVWLALPVFEYARYRAAVNGVVQDAVQEIVGVGR
jgi:hypothetical protein